MQSVRTSPGRVPAWLTALALAAAACAAPPADDRRERLRRELQAELGARYDEPLPPVSGGEELRRGAQLYDVLCEGCHGPTGNGRGKAARALTVPVPDLTDPAVAAFFSDRAKLRIIAEGLSGSPMIGWSHALDEPDRLAVLHYMDTLVRQASGSP